MLQHVLVCKTVFLTAGISTLADWLSYNSYIYIVSVCIEECFTSRILKSISDENYNHVKYLKNLLVNLL